MIPMLIAGIFNTVEFYVIVSVIAAAVIALVSLPERKGEVKTHLLAGNLIIDDNPAPVGPGNGMLTFECHAGNIVSLRRDGLEGVCSSGSVSLVVKVSGFDIVIEERITAGALPASGYVNSATFVLDFLAPEWYHIRYESDHFSEHASLTLHVREGIVVKKPLIH